MSQAGIAGSGGGGGGGITGISATGGTATGPVVNFDGGVSNVVFERSSNDISLDFTGVSSAVISSPLPVVINTSGELGIGNFSIQNITLNLNNIRPGSNGETFLNGQTLAQNTGSPVRTLGIAPDGNTGFIEVQISAAIPFSDSSQIGLCAFDSSTFSVDTSGFVTLLPSSLRYKENIKEDIDAVSRNIYKLHPVSFDYKKDGSRHIGMIAEEVFKVIPELVNANQDGQPDSIRYLELSVLLLNEIKKLNERIKALEQG